MQLCVKFVLNISDKGILWQSDQPRPFIHSVCPPFLSLYTARPSFEYYRQVYFVHPGLQDERMRVKLALGQVGLLSSRPELRRPGSTRPGPI